MGCGVSQMNRAVMSLFGRNSSSSNVESRAKLERKLYIAKESPEPEYDLSDCLLQVIPAGTYSICKVYRKQYLYLQENHLQSLQEGGQLSDLFLIKVLNISCNRFTHLPSDIRFLVNLTELYVQNNQLKHIPEAIEYLQSLQILDVSSNKLRDLTASLGKLTNLKRLNIKNNTELKELCSELCLARNLVQVELDGEQFVYPPKEICTQQTKDIMAFLCDKLNVDYIEPSSDQLEDLSVQMKKFHMNPFLKQNSLTWEEQEAAIVEQEQKIHQAAKSQREKFLSQVLKEQLSLDSEIAKVQEVKEIERQKLLKSIQDDEKEIECLVKNFIKSEYLKPEVIQQQLAHEQAEHDRLLEIVRQNYDNIRKADVLKAMGKLLEEDSSIQYSKKHYEDTLNNVKQSILIQELECTEKVIDLLKTKDQSRTVLVEQLLEDQDIQKAIVASLLERVDARSWSLNQEIALISGHLARLSVIEQEKKKMHIEYNYNELLQQRLNLVNLLNDLFDQQSKRRKQLVETLRDMEVEAEAATDFWLKNYQKLIDSAPRTLLDVGKSLDPLLANYLLQEGVIHCLPFLVKFLFSGESLMNINLEMLKVNGVILSSDRERIIRAINYYVAAKSQNNNFEPSTTTIPTAPLEDNDKQNLTGVVNTKDVEDSGLESECVICMDAKCEIVFIPCGHMCCCQNCGDQNVKSCPMCRGTVEKAIKVIIA